MNGYFREMHESNINPISPHPKFNLGIIQIIIIKSMSTIFSA